jgi:hypothetical protein
MKYACPCCGNNDPDRLWASPVARGCSDCDHEEPHIHSPAHQEPLLVKLAERNMARFMAADLDFSPRAF